MSKPSLHGRSWTSSVAGPSHPASRKRHSRWLTTPSAAVLLVCILLPQLRVCGTPVAMVELPMFWTPHIIAGLVFAATLALPSRLGGVAITMRILVAVTIVGFCSAIGFDVRDVAPIVAGLVALGLGALVIFVPARTPEAMVARIGCFVGIVAIPWFATIVLDRSALWGAPVSLAAAIAMAVGCAWWWGEAVLATRRRT